MRIFIRTISIIIIFIGIFYSYIAIIGFFNAEFISKQMVENSIIPIPSQFLPQLKKDVIKGDLLILLFGLICLSGGYFLYRKTKKR